jgi:predicted lipoprotein with Yx(FWY)xxD motif
MAASVASVALSIVALSGCGDSEAVGGSSVTTVASATSGTVDVKSVTLYGKILVTSSGRTLYLLSSDTPGGSGCVGSCAIAWPPLDTSGTMKAGPGVHVSLLSSFERSGGATQVLYNNHALYTYEEDTGPGMTTGQGVETYGGTWWVVSADGRAITK